MKPGPITELDKRDKTMSKKKDNNAISANCEVIVIFLIYDQFEQFRSQIPDTSSVKLTFSLIVTFYFAKTENRTKKYLT